MSPVVLHRAARLELDEAALWYELRRVDLGIEFIAEVDRCIALIAQHLDLSPVVHLDVRRMTLQRFPYSIDYRREAESIVVLAIFHSKRDPTIWQRRRYECARRISRATMLGAAESEQAHAKNGGAGNGVSLA